jgi:hypothetical protein
MAATMASATTFTTNAYQLIVGVIAGIYKKPLKSQKTGQLSEMVPG